MSFASAAVKNTRLARGLAQNMLSMNSLSGSSGVQTVPVRTFFSSKEAPVIPIPKNEDLPFPNCDPQDLCRDIDQQYRNPFTENVAIPYLYANNHTRDAVSKRVQATNNPILMALQAKLQNCESTGERFFLTDLPPTPHMNQDPRFIYEGDTEDLALPNPVSPDVLPNGKPSLNALITFKDTEIIDKEMAMQLYVNDFFRSSFFTNKPLDQNKMGFLARAAAERCLVLIRQRIDDPALYTAFGLEDCHSSRQAMLVLHAWMYLRTAQLRPTLFKEHYIRWVFEVVDQYARADLKSKLRRNKRVDLVMNKTLPAIRAHMTIYDKCVQSLVGGDPDPLYGALYRNVYRFSEESKFTQPQGITNVLLNRVPYVPSLDVYMDTPTDLANVNALVQYIVNNLYNNATMSPRDYYAHIMGLSDFVPLPVAPQHRLGGFTKLEMQRYCYPIYNDVAQPTRFQRVFDRLTGSSGAPAVDPSKFLLQPAVGGPAYRPPSFTYTLNEQLRGQNAARK